MAMSKMRRRPIFEKHFFPAENAGNIPEKPVFWHFIEILPLVFSDFLHKDAYWDCSKHSRVENTGNIPEIAVFADFHRTFSLYFIVFHTKSLSITMSTIKHG